MKKLKNNLQNKGQFKMRSKTRKYTKIERIKSILRRRY